MAVNKIIFGNDIKIDLTEDTVTPETLLLGATAHDKSGNVITGIYKPDFYKREIVLDNLDLKYPIKSDYIVPSDGRHVVMITISCECYNANGDRASNYDNATTYTDNIPTTALAKYGGQVGTSAMPMALATYTCSIRSGNNDGEEIRITLPNNANRARAIITITILTK